MVVSFRLEGDTLNGITQLSCGVKTKSVPFYEGETMAKFTSRFDDVLVDALDQLAGQHKLSRNALLEYLAEQAIKQGFIPIRPGEGFIATTIHGGTLSLIQEFQFVSAGSNNLRPPEQEAFQQAKQWADMGLWHQARQTLTTAGFTVTHTTR